MNFDEDLLVVAPPKLFPKLMMLMGLFSQLYLSFQWLPERDLFAHFRRKTDAVR